MGQQGPGGGRGASRPGRVLLAAAWLAGLVMAPAASVADSAALDVNRFHPALGTEKILTMDLAAVGPRWQLAPQLFFHYADAPMVLTVGDQHTADVVRHRVSGEIGLALSLKDRWQLGVSLPVTLSQSGDALDLEPLYVDDMQVNPPESINSAGLEDMRLSVKGVLWREGRYALGAMGVVTVPTGDSDSFLGSRLPTVTPSLIGHYQSGRLTAAVNLGWLFASTEQVLLTRTGMGLRFGAGAQYEVHRAGETNVALAAELVGLAHSRFESTRETPVELLLAAKSEHREWTFYLGAGSGMTRGYGEPDVRVLAGASFRWKPEPEPEPLVEPEPAPVEPAEEPPEEEDSPERRWVESIMTLPSDVLFEYDRCAINPVSYEELRKVAVALSNHPEWGQVRVEGHASQEGDQKDEYNLRLSRCRAERIVKFLAYYGVDASRLTYLGFGYRCPKVPNDTEENRKMNRRVEFVRNPESNPPRCEVPPQLEPLYKHSSEPMQYREQGGGAAKPATAPPAPGSQPEEPGPAPATQGSAEPGETPPAEEAAADEQPAAEEAAADESAPEGGQAPPASGNRGGNDGTQN